MRNIEIIPVLNGYVVKVGCQTVVFTSLDVMLEEIRAYMKNPTAVEKEYIQQGLNAKHLLAMEEPIRSAECNTKAVSRR